jgi:enolase
VSKILKVKARQVFDSRGNPTVEAEVYTKNNSATCYMSFWSIYWNF